MFFRCRLSASKNKTKTILGAIWAAKRAPGDRQGERFRGSGTVVRGQVSKIIEETLIKELMGQMEALAFLCVIEDMRVPCPTVRRKNKQR